MDKDVLNNTDLLKEVLKHLDALGEKMGVGANYFWPKFIKQEFIEAWVSLGSLIFFGVLFFLTTYYTSKLWNPKGEGYSIYAEDHEPIWIAALVIWGIGLFAAMIAFFTQFFDIFNPEYWALQSLFNTIK